jgi:hypothetical protein
MLSYDRRERDDLDLWGSLAAKVALGDSKPLTGHSSPKTTFSIIYNANKKNSIHFIDKKAVREIRPHNEKLGGKIDPYDDYVVDSIAYRGPRSGVPEATNAIPHMVATGGAGNTPTSPELEDAAWSDLELDKSKFLPSVVPQWTENGASPQKVSFILAIKARIKRKGKEFVIRLFRQVKPGHEEVADIYMEAGDKALPRVPVEPEEEFEIEEELQERTAISRPERAEKLPLEAPSNISQDVAGPVAPPRSGLSLCDCNRSYQYGTDEGRPDSAHVSHTYPLSFVHKTRREITQMTI